MSDAEFSPWIDLLVCVIERARSDAAGHTSDVGRGDVQAKVQAEAAEWLDQTVPVLAEWASVSFRSGTANYGR